MGKKEQNLDHAIKNFCLNTVLKQILLKPRGKLKLKSCVENSLRRQESVQEKNKNAAETCQLETSCEPFLSSSWHV